MRNINGRLAKLETEAAEREIQRYLDYWSSIPEADLELIAGGDEAVAARYCAGGLETFSVETLTEAERRLWLEVHGSLAGFEDYLSDLLALMR